jgi:hypothetical protein
MLLPLLLLLPACVLQQGGEYGEIFAALAIHCCRRTMQAWFQCERDFQVFWDNAGFDSGRPFDLTLRWVLQEDAGDHAGTSSAHVDSAATCLHSARSADLLAGYMGAVALLLPTVSTGALYPHTYVVSLSG